NHLWHTLAALCMTDGLLLAFYIAAFYALFCDPWLESRAALVGFSAAVAAAILTKGIAGIPPLAVLGLYWVAARRQERPSVWPRLWPWPSPHRGSSTSSRSTRGGSGPSTSPSRSSASAPARPPRPRT